MSTKDKLTGRLKKAAGDLLGDRSMRRQGVRDERRAEAKDDLARKEEELEEQEARVSDLDRESGRGRTGEPPTR